MSDTEKIKYQYKLIICNGGSAKYGPCEVCGEYCSEIFHQLERKRIILQPDLAVLVGKDNICEEYASTFGHEMCLIKIRK